MRLGSVQAVVMNPLMILGVLSVQASSDPQLSPPRSGYLPHRLPRLGSIEAARLEQQGLFLRAFLSTFSNPQPNPQEVMFCTTCAAFGSPRGLVSCCKT